MKTEILTAFTLLASFTACANTETRERVIIPAETSPTAPLTVYTPNPEIPDHVELWGKTISTDRTDIYERLDRELTSNAYTHGATLLNIKRANRYFPIIAPILEENGIPSDMLYLAVIESNLDERAVSPSKAAGIWQFMAATAKQYGLEVNDYVDERYNLEKATRAACRYFKEAYAKYGDWNAVAAAYNAGMGRVTKERNDQQQDDVLDLYLVTETSRYIFRIMALKLIMENPAHYGFSLRPEQLYQPLEYDVVEVKEPVADWTEWALHRGITYAQLREANPWIRAKSLPNASGKTYKVKILRNDSQYRSRQNVKVYNDRWVEKENL